jgi:hypothetical protein
LEHLDSFVSDLPVWEMAFDHGVGVQSGVSFADPPEDPPEDEILQVVESPRGRAVTEIVAPAS